MLAGIRDAQTKLEAEQPDRVITIGGNCMVSLAPEIDHGDMDFLAAVRRSKRTL